MYHRIQELDVGGFGLLPWDAAKDFLAFATGTAGTAADTLIISVNGLRLGNIKVLSWSRLKS